MDVSVVIAARNESRHVLEAIDSVATQSGLEMELVFVDDNSTDDTYAIVEAFAASHPNVRLVRNSKAGKCSAFNYGISLAKGRFVAIFAGDDIMPQGSLAERFSVVKAVSDTHPVVGLCRLQTLSDIPSEDGHVVPKAANTGGYTGVSYLMNRPAVDKIFPVPEDFPNEDTWMELCVRHLGFDVLHSGAIGCIWRVHAGNSINLRMPFAEFNAKLSKRLAVVSIFFEQFAAEMDQPQKRIVQAKVTLETNRAAGRVFAVMTTPVPLKERLRAAAYTNKWFYDLRRRLYGLLSGL